jgi:enoyl-CoA hydratase/carnithine racemase
LDKVVLYEVNPDARYAVITINRPEASNAINTRVMEELTECLSDASRDPDVHAVVLTGSGSRAFIAGGDLKEFHRDLITEELVYKKMSQMRTVIEQIVEFQKPIIAAVNGAARGGGGEVAAACHFRIASETASVGFVQVKLAISPGWGGGILLQRIVGRQLALRMLLSGDVYDAKTLEGFGFFDQVTQSDQLLDTATAFAKRLAAHSPEAVQGILALLKDAETLPVKQAMEAESRLCARLWMTPEHLQKVQEMKSKSFRSESGT